MMMRLAIAGLVAVAAWAQAPPSSRLIGTVEKLGGDHLQIRSGPRVLTLQIDGRTELHRGRTYRNLSPLRLGDEVSVQVRADSPDRPIAVSVWAEVVTFRATIHSVSPESFTVILQRDQAPEAYRRGYNRVFVYPETRFSTSARDLGEGADVLVVGVDAGAGNVDALRVAVYNTDVPQM